MRHADGEGVRLDDKLEEFAAGIVQRVGFDPPELKTKLRKPQLCVVRGPRGLNSYCVPMPDGTRTILVGADLDPFSSQYTRAAAAYFLPSTPNGVRPSHFWHDARAAMATTLDWLASPAAKRNYAEFEVTPQQAKAARALHAFAFRFALCHEMAHVVLGHVDAGPTETRRVADTETRVLLASQEQEWNADALGLHLQLKSLPDTTQLVNGLAGAVYFVHVMAQLDTRLGLLAPLVDHTTWEFARSHPPTLLRLFHLMRHAEGLHGGSAAGLQKLHTDLSGMDGELLDAAGKQQQEVVAAALEIIKKQYVTARETSGGGHAARAFVAAAPPPDAARELLRLFHRSPLGVTRALGSPPTESLGSVRAETDQVWFEATDRLARILPPEFQRFRRQSPAERAKELA